MTMPSCTCKPQLSHHLLECLGKHIPQWPTTNANYRRDPSVNMAGLACSCQHEAERTPLPHHALCCGRFPGSRPRKSVPSRTYLVTRNDNTITQRDEPACCWLTTSLFPKQQIDGVNGDHERRRWANKRANEPGTNSLTSNINSKVSYIPKALRKAFYQNHTITNILQTSHKLCQAMLIAITVTMLARLFLQKQAKCRDVNKCTQRQKKKAKEQKSICGTVPSVHDVHDDARPTFTRGTNKRGVGEGTLPSKERLRQSHRLAGCYPPGARPVFVGVIGICPR